MQHSNQKIRLNVWKPNNVTNWHVTLPESSTGSTVWCQRTRETCRLASETQTLCPRASDQWIGPVRTRSRIMKTTIPCHLQTHEDYLIVSQNPFIMRVASRVTPVLIHVVCTYSRSQPYQKSTAKNFTLFSRIGPLCPFRDIRIIGTSWIIRCCKIALMEDTNLILCKRTDDAVQ